MPSGLLEAYVERMEAVAAVRALEAADAAVYPHLTKKGAEEWWKRHAGRTAPRRATRRRRRASSSSADEKAKRPMFTLSLVDDGATKAHERPMSFRGLESQLRGINRAVGSDLRVLDDE